MVAGGTENMSQFPYVLRDARYVTIFDGFEFLAIKINMQNCVPSKCSI